MIEGERRFDISVRWPKKLRSSETDILDIPVDIGNNSVVQSSGPSNIPGALGTSLATPSTVGTQFRTDNPLSNTPRLRSRDLVSPVGDDGSPAPDGQFERHGASTIYREQGKRLIAIKFSVAATAISPAPSPRPRPKRGSYSRRPIGPSGAENSRRCRMPSNA